MKITVDLVDISAKIKNGKFHLSFEDWSTMKFIYADVTKDELIKLRDGLNDILRDNAPDPTEFTRADE